MNAERVNRKLPSLLICGNAGSRVNDNLFMPYRYRLGQMQRRRPQQFNTLMVRLVRVLEEVEKKK